MKSNMVRYVMEKTTIIAKQGKFARGARYLAAI
jgi:membrane-bound inhibitor of C-type lysozyme